MQNDGYKRDEFGRVIGYSVAPIITDQEDTVLIGVRKTGATVKDSAKFEASIAATRKETRRTQRAYLLLQRSFLTGKSIAQLQREDCRRKILVPILAIAAVIAGALAAWGLIALARNGWL